MISGKVSKKKRTALAARLLVTPGGYCSDKPVVLSLEVENISDGDVCVLKWFTPMEGLCSNCMTVFRNGTRLNYDGPLAKRGQPAVHSYVRISAGETRNFPVVLDEAYTVSRPSEYEVYVNIPRMEYLHVSPKETVLSVLGNEPEIQSLVSDMVRFTVKKQVSTAKYSNKFATIVR